ncbi:hypothetical protein GobsT_48130 [Gemmata obscuriglobus]|uniref:Uncharacterized protein n=1 Tax=Gemmata obscuriglobus TaxID=114 RepID=A0A2Z3GU02_9BACT|nr:hypothetical protein [Gemmata obscuriglobus]AWM37243.1 hypothetical protein C1280_09540 [Gemmata obscuriglobus]QEG30013.1 hypothetical protein GobsT_48130 [Gemmata obscuriglobus]VTS09334.1 unnamed protein product [Gemmata obscuriglobus UQM 2246]
MPLAAGAAIIGGGWLLTVVFVSAVLPRFVRVFDKLAATGVEMPVLTRMLMPLGRFGAGPAAMIGTGAVALLVVVYAGWVRARLPGGRIIPALAVAAVGVMTFIVCVAAVLLPAIIPSD